MMVIRFIPLVVAIACTVYIEVVLRRFATRVNRWPFRIGYPIWIGVSLRSIPGLGWLVWLVAAYAVIVGLFGLRWGQRIRFRAQIEHDFRLWRQDYGVALQKARKIQHQRSHLEQHGCPMGLDCDDMGRDRLGGCVNFGICKGW